MTCPRSPEGRRNHPAGCSGDRAAPLGGNTEVASRSDYDAPAPWRRFLRDENGASMPLTAAVLLPLMGFIGLGTDAARGYLVKARLGDALDAAVLAAAHEKETDQLQAELQKYFNANFPPGYMGTTVTLHEAELSGDADEIINISASAVMNTTFMGLFGFKQLGIGTATEVTRQTVNMDVVLSMDMSGSMGNSDGSGSTRIAAARTAANTLVDILYGNQTTTSLLNVGLVPWNGAVNVWLNGTTSYDRTLTTTTTVPSFENPWEGENQTLIYSNPVTPVPLLANPWDSWEGCVFARYKNSLDNPDGIADHLLAPVTTVDGTEWLAWPTNGDTGDPEEEDAQYYSSCLTYGITPLNGTRATIEAAIDELITPNGHTNIAQGLAWAWRVVSPGVPFDEADPFPTGLHERAIVLLTDGEQYGATDDGYNTAFGSGAAAGAGGMDARLLAVAANAKAEGIKIYVIQFYYSSGPLQSLLQQVATEPHAPFYHFAPDGNELNKIFKRIGDDLSALRISR